MKTLILVLPEEVNSTEFEKCSQLADAKNSYEKLHEGEESRVRLEGDGVVRRRHSRIHPEISQPLQKYIAYYWLLRRIFIWHIMMNSF